MNVHEIEVRRESEKSERLRRALLLQGFYVGLAARALQRGDYHTTRLHVAFAASARKLAGPR